MAKANVVARRIRAYGRRLVEMTNSDGEVWGWVDPLDHKRMASRLEAARAWMASFLAGRTKGPWAAVARKEAV